MRLTFAIYLELSLDRSRPGFFDGIAQYPFAQHLDRSAARVRHHLTTLEFDEVRPGDEGNCFQVAERAAEQLADDAAQRMGLPASWRDFGKVSVIRVADAPNPSSTHGMEGPNNSVRCPVCEGPMNRKQSRNGPFWSCVSYPACKGTRNISQ